MANAPEISNQTPNNIAVLNGFIILEWLKPYEFIDAETKNIKE